MATALGSYKCLTPIRGPPIKGQLEGQEQSSGGLGILTLGRCCGHDQLLCSLVLVHGWSLQRRPLYGPPSGPT